MNELNLKFFAVIHQIPVGKVTTYGDVAHFSGLTGYARQVGRALKNLPNDSALPWHRVVNSQGGISLTGDRLIKQKQRLMEEGVEFRKNGKVNMQKSRWQG